MVKGKIGKSSKILSLLKNFLCLGFISSSPNPQFCFQLDTEMLHVLLSYSIFMFLYLKSILKLEKETGMFDIFRTLFLQRCNKIEVKTISSKFLRIASEATLLKKRLWHRAFPMNFVNF